MQLSFLILSHPAFKVTLIQLGMDEIVLSLPISCCLECCRQPFCAAQLCLPLGSPVSSALYLSTAETTPLLNVGLYPVVFFSVTSIYGSSKQSYATSSILCASSSVLLEMTQSKARVTIRNTSRLKPVALAGASSNACLSILLTENLFHKPCRFCANVEQTSTSCAKNLAFIYFFWQWHLSQLKPKHALIYQLLTNGKQIGIYICMCTNSDPALNH